MAVLPATKRFADIYRINHTMGFAVKKEQWRLYAGISLLFFVLMQLSAFLTDREHFWQRTLNHAWITLYITTNNYILFEITIPFLRAGRKRLWWLPVIALAHLVLYSAGAYSWRMVGIMIHTYFEIMVFKNLFEGMNYFIRFSAASVVFYGIIRHLYHHVKLRRSAQQLRIEKQQAELNYLKAQTNPHFLFNTLNNIYSLARDKSDLAPESILRLSKILRYMLYETNGQHITLEQELKIMTDYIELEKLRYDESLQIRFSQQVEDMKQTLPPLLLMPLVENAFKHGVSETRHHPFIDIHLSVQRQQLQLVVKNSIEAVVEQEVLKENIGLSNLRRQLQLLYADHLLTVKREQDVFSAQLKINLASHVPR
jgi:two-component system, LytTR family, sensor kinase